MIRSNNLLILVKLTILFSIIPFYSFAGIIVINGLTHTHDVIPNESYRGSIEIQNTGNVPQAVKVYQQDYSFNHNNEVFYNPPGTISRSNAAWIDVSPKYLILQAKEKTKISYQVSTPEGSDLAGTFWSVIMVEGENPVDSNQLKNGLNINTKVRYAIQIATTFNKPGERNLTFINANLLKADTGQQYLSVDIENKGAFLQKPNVSVELFDHNGQSVGVFETVKKKIYPNTSARFYIDMVDVGAGQYQALLLADCGEEDVYGINLDLDFTDD